AWFGPLPLPAPAAVQGTHADSGVVHALFLHWLRATIVLVGKHARLPKKPAAEKLPSGPPAPGWQLVAFGRVARQKRVLVHPTFDAFPPRRSSDLAWFGPLPLPAPAAVQGTHADSGVVHALFLHWRCAVIVLVLKQGREPKQQ